MQKNAFSAIFVVGALSLGRAVSVSAQDASSTAPARSAQAPAHISPDANGQRAAKAEYDKYYAKAYEFWEHDQLKEAVAQYVKAMEVAPSASDKYYALKDLAHVYEQLHQDADAEPLYRELVAAGQGGKFGMESEFIDPLIGTLIGQKKYAQAEPFAQRSLELVKLENVKKAAWSGNAIASHLWQLGTVYLQCGKFVESEGTFASALKLVEPLPSAPSTSGPDCIDMAAPLDADAKNKMLALCLEGLAQSYAGEGQFKQAEPLYARALVLRSKLKGENDDHAAKQELLTNYIATLKKLGNNTKATALMVQLKKQQ